MNLLTVFVISTFITTSTQEMQLELKVYYESLCPDSKEFITGELKPTATKFGQYLNIYLIPFGKAHMNNSTHRITCQHGSAECYGNAFHACGITRLHNNQDQVNFVSCVFSYRRDLYRGGIHCSQLYGLSWDNVSKCANGSEGHTLQQKNGVETTSLQPPLTWVPTITLDGQRGSPAFQLHLINNLLPTICRIIRKNISDHVDC